MDEYENAFLDFCSSDIGISLVSALVGGMCALLGAFMTIKFYKKQEKETRRKEDNRNIAGFYFMLLEKANKLCIWMKNTTEPFIVQVTPIYTNDENMFLYDRLQNILAVTSEEDVRELVAFLSDLHQLENARNECLISMHQGIQINNEDKTNYINILTHCEKKLYKSEEQNMRGILEILGSLEKYAQDV